MSDTPKTTAPASAPQTTPPVLSNEEILDALGKQIDAIEIPNLDSESAKAWLKDFRLPLASLTTNALIGLVQVHESGTSDQELEEVLSHLTPSELNQVLKVNLAALNKITSQRVREAALLRATTMKLTTSAASMLMSGLLRVLGVPFVAAATAPPPEQTA
jgi:hypothetical protein